MTLCRGIHEVEGDGGEVGRWGKQIGPAKAERVIPVLVMMMMMAEAMVVMMIKVMTVIM